MAMPSLSIIRSIDGHGIFLSCQGLLAYCPFVAVPFFKVCTWICIGSSFFNLLTYYYRNQGQCQGRYRNQGQCPGR
jgi:hypothetical protein